MRITKIAFLYIVISSLGVSNAWGQTTTTSSSAEEQDIDVDVVERQLEKEVDFETTRLKMPTKAWKVPQTVDYSKILSLKSYEDMVAIQKNYMPLTKRFQGSLGFSWLTNDNFYTNYGFEGRLGYHLDEMYGLEVIYSSLNSQSTYKVEDLKTKQGLSVTSLVTPKSFLGASLFFSTMYGKWSVNNRSITAFNIYQSLGAGKMTTTSGDAADAFFFGLGQMTSLSRNSFWRVDLTWYFYNTTNINQQKQDANSLFLTVYWGGFMPKVGSRQ
ncbi:MAG: outer membrane beta-barrel domain-containing protein [Bdellovibrionota bacterium]